MGRVFHSYYTRPKPNGKGRERVTSRRWCAEWTAADGSTKRKTIGLDKRAAEIYLARRVEEVERERAGLGAPVDSSPARQPILELLDTYLEVLEARDTSPEYRATIRQRVTDAARACHWQTWADVRADAFEAWLRRLRVNRGIDGRGLGPATTNGYLRDLKGFCKWIADSLDTTSPLRKLKPVNEEIDRRRSELILSDAEFEQLLVAAASAPGTSNTIIPGRDRAMLYRVAAFTGLRASELAALTPAMFDLAATPPRVSPPAADQKARRADVIPLPRLLVAALRKFLRGKDMATRIWPGTWAEHRRQVRWFWRDLRRAGIGTTGPKGQQLGPDGKPYHFHALRRSYVTALIRSGADVDEVRRLARHRDVRTTLRSYAKTDLATLGAAADKLGR